MLKIYNLQNRQEFLREVAYLTYNEWGTPCNSRDEYELKIDDKVWEMVNNFDNPSYCRLILLYDDLLIGFISIFPSDCDERKDLSPWYSTMFVNKEFRGMGYSRILNNAVLEEAKNRGFEKIYLKTTLNNYYEKFGAIFLENLSDGEKLYYFDLKNL